MKRLLPLLAVAAFLAGGCGLFKPRGYPYSELAKRFPPYRKAEFHTAVGAKTGLFCYHGMWQASAATNAITWIGDKEELWRTPDLPCEWIIQIFENESGEKLYMIYRFQPLSCPRLDEGEELDISRNVDDMAGMGVPVLNPFA